MIREILRSLFKTEVTTSTSSSTLAVEGNTVTLDVDGQVQTFDITAGIPAALAERLAAMGLSVADVERMRNLAQPALPGASQADHVAAKNDLVATPPSREEFAEKLGQLLHLSSSEVQELARSGNWTAETSLTFTINGNPAPSTAALAYLPSSVEHLAEQMGLSPKSFWTYLKVFRHDK